MISGPVLSDIKQGCQVPNAPNVAMCDVDANGNPQQKCYGWPAGPNYQTISPTFTDGYEYGPRAWTNIGQCAASGPTTLWNSVWQGQSIVNQQTVPQQFAYPKTGLRGWLCSTVYGGGKMNNSASQGEIFYQQFTTTFPINYGMYAVDNCDMAEGVIGQYATIPGLGNAPSLPTIENDMIAQCVNHHPN